MEEHIKTKEALDLRGFGEKPDVPHGAVAPERTPPTERNQSFGRVTWETEEFPYHEKDSQWFLFAGIVTCGIVISLVIMGNIFGAVTFLLFAVIGYLYATKKPEILHVTIDAKGIAVNDKLIPYSQMASFWVLYEPPLKDLIIIQKEKFTVKTIIPLGNAHPVDVRAQLMHNAIAEKEEEESIAEILSRRFRF